MFFFCFFSSFFIVSLFRPNGTHITLHTPKFHCISFSLCVHNQWNICKRSLCCNRPPSRLLFHGIASHVANVKKNENALHAMPYRLSYFTHTCMAQARARGESETKKSVWEHYNVNSLWISTTKYIHKTHIYILNATHGILEMKIGKRLTISSSRNKIAIFSTAHNQNNVNTSKNDDNNNLI